MNFWFAFDFDGMCQPPQFEHNIEHNIECKCRNFRTMQLANMRLISLRPANEATIGESTETILLCVAPGTIIIIMLVSSPRCKFATRQLCYLMMAIPAAPFSACIVSPLAESLALFIEM